MTASLIKHIENYLHATDTPSSLFRPSSAKSVMVKVPPKTTPRLQPRLYISPNIIPPANVERELRLTLISLTNSDTEVCAYRERPWASATFIGARHYWTLKIKGEAHARIASDLETIICDHEFSIRGHIVADAIMTSRCESADTNNESGTIVTLEILTIEDD